MIYDPFIQTREDKLAVCAENGWVYFEAQDDELFLDIDQDKGLVLNAGFLDRFRDTVDVNSLLSVPSKTSGNTHVYLKLYYPRHGMERLLMETLLGSDPMRAFVVLKGRAASTFNTEIPWSVFFESPENAEKVNAWRKSFK